MLALTVVGSPLYVSPEIIYDGCYDAKVFKRNHIGNFDFQYQKFDQKFN